MISAKQVNIRLRTLMTQGMEKFSDITTRSPSSIFSFEHIGIKVIDIKTTLMFLLQQKLPWRNWKHFTILEDEQSP
jgi:hypothetical protein